MSLALMFLVDWSWSGTRPVEYFFLKCTSAVPSELVRRVTRREGPLRDFFHSGEDPFSAFFWKKSSVSDESSIPISRKRSLAATLSSASVMLFFMFWVNSCISPLASSALKLERVPRFLLTINVYIHLYLLWEVYRAM